MAFKSDDDKKAYWRRNINMMMQHQLHNLHKFHNLQIALNLNLKKNSWSDFIKTLI